MNQQLSSQNQSRVYLDNNATTVIDPEVLRVFFQALEEVFANPSAIYEEARSAKMHLQQARQEIADCLHAATNEIVFTSCATESINALLRGVFGYAPRGHLITSSLEHAAVWQTARDLQTQGVDVTFLPGDISGRVHPDQVRQALRPDTKVIALMAVNNETGVINDIEEIGRIAYEHGCACIVDGVAMLGKMPVTIHKGISAMVFSGHKFHAPKGSSFSFIRKGLVLHSFITGGNQEFGRRAGTENVAGSLALACAVRHATQEIDKKVAEMKALRDEFEARIIQKWPFVVVNGSAPRVCNTSSLTFAGIDGEALVMYADLHGLSCAMGSACA
ncbi:MAG TPA: cysteine desulfurase family protein, partial [Anaerolineales bacterium]|nr:cysteine desulfurase family protein [Anaerolineales bacterium]